MGEQAIKDPRAPGWTFTGREISAGHYLVEGCHIDGRSVSRAGGEAALEECIEDARSLGDIEGKDERQSRARRDEPR